MRYQYSPNSPERFATNLRRDMVSKKLMWDNARGQDVLIVQTPFGQNAAERMPAVCQALGDLPQMPNTYVEVLTNIWVRFVTAADKAKNQGCPLHGEASTYTVFSYYIDNGICHVCEPLRHTMIAAYYDVPLEIRVNISQQTKQEGFLWWKEEVETGFYSVSFPPEVSSTMYADGDLCYVVEGFTIPVTRKMLEQGTIYIKTAVKPSVISKSKGLRLL